MPPVCPGSHKNGVKHYHIKRVEGKYYVTERHRFDTIPELIEYHKHNAGGEIIFLLSSLYFTFRRGKASQPNPHPIFSLPAPFRHCYPPAKGRQRPLSANYGRPGTWPLAVGPQRYYTGQDVGLWPVWCCQAGLVQGKPWGRGGRVRVAQGSTGPATSFFKPSAKGASLSHSPYNSFPRGKHRSP